MRLIDADLLMRSFQVDMCGSFTCHECPLWNDDGECGFEVFISDTPTVGAEPVVYAHWKKEYKSGVKVKDGYVSSCCDMWNERKTSYCPHCGAKIYEVMNDENK